MKGFIVALTALSAALTGCNKASLSRFTTEYAGTLLDSAPHSCTPALNKNAVSEEGSENFETSGCNWISILDQKIWTADFDPGAIIHGECTYSAEGNRVFLARYIGSLKLFEYRLEEIRHN